MAITFHAYKQLYKHYLSEHNLDDDSSCVTGLDAMRFIKTHVGWDEEEILEYCKEHEIDPQSLSYPQIFDEPMMTFELYFDDLNEDAQTRFRDAGLWHENIEMSPLAIFELEKVLEDE